MLKNFQHLVNNKTVAFPSRAVALYGITKSYLALHGENFLTWIFSSSGNFKLKPPFNSYIL